MRTGGRAASTAGRAFLALALCLCSGVRPGAQNFTSRLAMLVAEERGAKTLADLQTIRVGLRSNDTDAARQAVRAFGHLQRPQLIPEMLPSLRHMQPEVRVEAAHALAYAALGLRPPAPASPSASVGSIQNALVARLDVEEDASVRAAICEALARLPYRTAADVERAEQTILGLAGRATALADRLGVAKALEALVRLQTPLRPASADAIAILKMLVRASAPPPNVARDARVRRLALEALIATAAADDQVIAEATNDPDPQVRRLAVRAAALSTGRLSTITDGLLDRAPMVRIEALQALASRDREAVCSAAIRLAADPDLAVALVAVDTLSVCAATTGAVAYLERRVSDRSELASPRGWHHNAHALVALAAAAPDRARPLVAEYAGTAIWQVRVYATQAAILSRDRDTLARLAADRDERVATLARSALGETTPPAKPGPPEPPVPAAPFTTADLQRLAAPRARVTVRDVGRFELALFTAEAPGTVLRFARLAEAGYYNGRSFDSVQPNAVLQVGWRPGDEDRFRVNEVGGWPHVRGTVGLSPANGQFFIDLVDNPRFDHERTVFAQVLNGADVIDRILEGDVIDSIEIVP